MTLAELEDYVLNLENNLNGSISELEKEVAILKGRTDGLEAQLGQIQSYLQIQDLTSLYVIDSYDLNTGDYYKNIKPITGNFLSSQRIYSSDDIAIVISAEESIFIRNNENTNYKTKRIKNYENMSQTGQDLVLGSGYISKTDYINHGFLPTRQGQRLIINRQPIC
jgi:hypothetical protein